MKEFFIAKKFGSAALALLETIQVIVEKYQSQGFDLSLRQLYYQLVAANVIPNNERSYKNIGNLVSDARLAGIIDWDAIEDRGRVTIRNSHWENPASILSSAISSFQIDKWEDQPSYVEVMVEKQALEGVLVPVCESLDIPFSANKGYSSSSALYALGKRLRAKMNNGKQVHLIYLGDHDPSGIDMTRDVLARSNLFTKSIDEQMFKDGDISPSEGVMVRRIALNIEQIKKLKPPENPAKLTDSRADAYIERFGQSSWELDAIEPNALAGLVRNAVYEIRDPDLWAKSLEREKAMKDELKKFAKTSKFK